MPTSASAKKRVRQDAKKSAYNYAIKKSVKTSVKSFDAAVETKSEDIKAKSQAAISKIDKACKKGIMHKNSASRQKSKIMKKAAEAMK